MKNHLKAVCIVIAFGGVIWSSILGDLLFATSFSLSMIYMVSEFYD